METSLGTLPPLPWLAEHGDAAGEFRFELRSGRPDRQPEPATRLVALEPAVVLAGDVPAIRAAPEAGLFELAVSLKVARAAGLALPPSMLPRAGRVVP